MGRHKGGADWLYPAAATFHLKLHVRLDQGFVFWALIVAGLGVVYF